MNLVEQLQIIDVQQEGLSCTAKMVLGDFHSQPWGFLNGGATLAFAEALAGMASNERIEKGFIAVGQSVTANHLRPMKATGILKAEGTLLLAGQRSHVWQFHMLNEDGHMISQVTVTNAIISSR